MSGSLMNDDPREGVHLGERSSLDGTRVLMVGKNSVVFMEPLAESIKTVVPGIELSIAGLTEPSHLEDVSPAAGGSFDHYLPELDPFVMPRDRGGKGPVAAPATPLRKLWRRVTSRLTRSRVVRQVATGFEPLRERVDLLHLHGLFLGPIHWWLRRGTGLPYVVSCWGSDVLRVHEPRRIRMQGEILRGASCITVTTPEMKEVLVEKYGRDLEDKIVFAFFPPDVHGIATAERASVRESFLRKHRIEAGKIVVAVGHSGNAGGQQREMLASLRDVGKEQLDRLHVLVPMTYGAEPALVEEVRTLLGHVGCSGEVLVDFLSDDEIEELRLGTDIFLYGPVTDSFSGTVSQALAAGSVGLLGSWLPYSLRREAGFRYWEFDAPDGAGPALADLLERWPEPVKEVEPNRQLSAEYFAPTRIGRGWIEAYDMALKTHRKPLES